MAGESTPKLLGRQQALDRRPSVRVVVHAAHKYQLGALENPLTMTSARRFAFLLPCLFAADAAPVSPVSTFCATGLDTVVVNNVTQSQFGPYKICMSVDELVWRQELEGVTTLCERRRAARGPPASRTRR